MGSLDSKCMVRHIEPSPNKHFGILIIHTYNNVCHVCAKHSTETALLKVQNNILCEIDAKRVVFIILLDLSAAFNTVDHSILLKLQRLEKRFNIGGVALQ